MVHNTNKRLFRMVTKLGREGLKKLAEDSKVTKNPDGLAQGSQASKGEYFFIHQNCSQIF
jgi:hypothetical protein